MSLLYHAFGLTLQANRPIPGLSASTDPAAAVDVHIDFINSRPNHPHDSPKELWYESAKDQNDQILRVWKLAGNKGFLFLYSDGTEFLLDSTGKHVTASWPDTLTFADMSSYLIGPILGFVLRLRGVVCLHASAVVVSGFALAILSPSGYGKSTMAAAFARRGYPVLSDDIVALVDQANTFLVQPAFPRIHLWPSSVKALFGSDNALPRITPKNISWDKRYLDLCHSGYRFQTTPLRLGAIYTGEHTDEKDIPRLGTLSAQDGLMTLIANTYSSGLLARKMRASEFDVLCRLVASVPVKCFKSREGFGYLHRICDIILEDAQRFFTSTHMPEP